ncbi:MAG: hypothetical protein JW833_16075 [Prolixibacteraceae bacterium]|nr:hypothetical protein [Prolixibacteraceae bacterium]
MKRYILITLILSFSVLTFAADKGKIEVPLRFDRYYNYDDVTTALKALNNAFPKLTTLEVVGQSEEGRNIYALTINNPETGNHLEKPGVYIDGNIHGNEIQAGEVCLYYANMLLSKYGENEKITKVVDKNAHYIIPVVNVDGRYHFFEDANTPDSNRSIRIPKDDDNDGLVDEDGYDDLDGDGNICQMRIKDPFGNYKTDPEDPRLMMRVRGEEKGEWTVLGLEGIDNDHDGRINEDSEGYLDPNRNWGFDWMPPYVQSGAGLYPMSGVGLKSIAKFIEARPNIIMGYAFHNNGGLWLRPPSSSDIRIDNRDIAVFDILGTNSEKIDPDYVYQPAYDLYPTYGDFDSYLYDIIGAYSFTGELFIEDHQTYRKDTKKPTPTLQDQSQGRRGTSQERNREVLDFNDHVALGELYKDWVPYHHPLYGDIEIGGWIKMSSRLPHPFMLTDLVHRAAAAVLFASENTPEVKMEVTETKDLGNGLKRVRVRLSNENALPSMTYQAITTKLHPKDILKVSGVKVVAGGTLTDQYMDKVNYKEYRPEIQFLSVPSYGKIDFQFIVEGKGQMQIEYTSQKAKDLKASVKL